MRNILSYDRHARPRYSFKVGPNSSLPQLSTPSIEPLGIGNLGAPIAPNPAVAAALVPADAAMATLLSGKVFISQT